MDTPNQLLDPGARQGHIGGGSAQRSPPNRRTIFFFNTISIRGWPSRGGLIVLHWVTALDFEFLGFDAVNPPLRRDSNQDAEDEFCQRLLLLGAKKEESRPHIMALENEEEGAHVPSTMERRWISVGYPSGPKGGLWVSEYDTTMYGMQEQYNLVPPSAVQVLLAKTMNEKCEVLKSLGAKFYAALRIMTVRRA
ncbi:hypothetical protein B0O99DRAFT_594417 [Bisporella sp. PMI_857]|nr:hypothetical protein B0O99DRAFT_594417 [Bisporella sp. PMI_857]